MGSWDSSIVSVDMSIANTLQGTANEVFNHKMFIRYTI